MENLNCNTCKIPDDKTAERKLRSVQKMVGPFYMFWSMNVPNAAADAHIALPVTISDGYIHLMLVLWRSASRLRIFKLRVVKYIEGL